MAKDSLNWRRTNANTPHSTGLSAGAPGPMSGANAAVIRFSAVEMIVPGSASTASASVGCGTVGTGSVGATNALMVLSGNAFDSGASPVASRAAKTGGAS